MNPEDKREEVGYIRLNEKEKRLIELFNPIFGNKITEIVRTIVLIWIHENLEKYKKFLTTFKDITDSKHILTELFE